MLFFLIYSAIACLGSTGKDWSQIFSGGVIGIIITKKIAAHQRAELPPRSFPYSKSWILHKTWCGLLAVFLLGNFLRTTGDTQIIPAVSGEEKGSRTHHIWSLQKILHWGLFSFFFFLNMAHMFEGNICESGLDPPKAAGYRNFIRV